MNILPKKNWHVLKKENIFKVKADIAKAKALENENLRKSEVSNQETYLSILRKQSKSKTRSSEINETVTDSDPLHLSKPKINVDCEREEKQKREKFEKNIGLLTFLGQSVIDSRDKDDLWWTKTNNSSVTKCSEEKKRKQEILIKKDDPLESILYHQKCIEKQKEAARSMMGPKPKQFPKEIFIRGESEKKFHKKTKKKKHRHRSRSSSSSSSSDSSDRDRRKRKKKAEKLRVERLEREKVERSRADLAIQKSSGRLFPI